MPTSADPPWLQQAIAKGLVKSIGPTVLLPGAVHPPPERSSKPEPRELRPASFTPPGTWIVPVYVVSGDNTSGTAGKHFKIGRSGHERRAVYRVLARQHREFAPFADAAQAGTPIRCYLTRLGGRGMDTDGLAASLKYIRDAVADYLGVGDGPRGPVEWIVTQEPGGLPGVRIELAIGGAADGR